MQLGPVPCLPGRRRCLSTSLMRVASLIDTLIQMVVTSFTERSLDEVDPDPCQTKVLAHIVSHMRTEEEIRKTVDAYLLKYYSKPSPTTLASTGTVSKWQAQAQMLSRALPIDVVRVVGVHVREQAAVESACEELQSGSLIGASCQACV